MLPEEKIARRFSEKRGLEPPIDVEALVREFAVLEEDSLPADYDAVFLDKSPKHPRPRVIIAVGQPPTRRAFTLAHELGHIVIPWHNGTHFCRVDSATRLTNDIMRGVESQANRFAAELLMPTAWVAGLIGSVEGLKKLIDAVKQANVSAHAVSIRLIQLLPAGFAFVEVDSKNCVVRAAASPETGIRLPGEGSQFKQTEFSSLADDSAILRSGSSHIYWWHFLSKIQQPIIISSVETSSGLIQRIAKEIFPDDSATKKALMTVNGIIGAANGTNLLRGKKDLFTVLKQRFLGRREIAPLVEHELFDEFLVKRVREIETRRQTDK